jgi:hypothetical protein
VTGRVWWDFGVCFRLPRRKCQSILFAFVHDAHASDSFRKVRRANPPKPTKPTTGRVRASGASTKVWRALQSSGTFQKPAPTRTSRLLRKQRTARESVPSPARIGRACTLHRHHSTPAPMIATMAEGQLTAPLRKLHEGCSRPLGYPLSKISTFSAAARSHAKECRVAMPSAWRVKLSADCGASAACLGHDP